MNILIGGEKEGTGKTTIAVNIAALQASYGLKVAIVDTDKQESALNWARIRSTLISGKKVDIPKVDALGVTGQVQDMIKDLSRRYDHVIIDAGGRDSTELRSAMLVADKFFTPVRASQFDLMSLDRLHAIVKEAYHARTTRLKACVFVNCASTNPKVNDTLNAVEYITSYNLFSVGQVIKERAAFKKTGYSGLGVHELPTREYNKDAFNELVKLNEEILYGQ